MKKLFWLLFVVSCNSATPLEAPPTYHLTFDSTYYHVQVNRGLFQTIYPIEAQTDLPNNEKVIWESDTYWVRNSAVIGQLDTIPTVNCCSYPYDGRVRNVFAPVQVLIGDTATVIVWSSINGVVVSDTAYFVMY